MNLKYCSKALLLFFLLFFVYAYFLHWDDFNQNSRLDLVLAIVQEGRLTIDSFHDTPFTGTDDKSFYRGHYYSDKAIGTSMLGTIVYFPLYWLMHLLRHDLNVGYVHVPYVLYLITLFTVGLPSAFAGSLIYVLGKYISKSSWRAYVISLAIALGTMCLPYSALFYGHQLAASLLFIAFFMILKLKVESRKPGFIYQLVIGFLLGFALITEYTTAVIVPPIIIYYFYTLWKLRLLRMPAMIIVPMIGGLVPIFILLSYNVVCFDSPFSIGYGHLASMNFQKGMELGLMGIRWPRPIVLYYITIHPVRGLFVQSPVLIASLIGFFFILKERSWRVEGVLSAFPLISYLLINSGYYQWWGGWTFGPRHLIPLLPFLCLPLIFFPKRFFYVVVILTFFSMLQMFIVTAQQPEISDSILSQIKTFPFFGSSVIYCLKKLMLGQYATNLGNLLSLSGLMSLMPLIIVLTCVSALFLIQSSLKHENE